MVPPFEFEITSMGEDLPVDPVQNVGVLARSAFGKAPINRGKRSDSDPSATNEVVQIHRDETHPAGSLTTVNQYIRESGGTYKVPTLRFVNVQNATTCQSYMLSWTYEGPNLTTPITLYINENPRYNPSVMSISRYPELFGSKQQPAIRLLSTNITSQNVSFTWAPVDLKQGWYMLNAVRTNLQANQNKFSAPPAAFFVRNGTDTTCVKPSLPISLTTHPKLSKADIVAIAIAGVVATALLIIAFAFPRWWRRDLPSPKRPRPYYLY